MVHAAEMRRVLLPIMMLFVLTGAAACGGDDDDSAGPEIGADVEDVANEDEEESEAATDGETAAGEGSAGTSTEGTGDGANLGEEAAAFVGQQVTVSATISEIVSPSAFRIGDASSVLVVSAPAPEFSEMGFELDDQLVEDGTVLQITGTVREFDIAGFEDEFGIDYDDALFESYEGEHVIVADRVTTITGQELTVAGEVESVLSTVAFRLAGVGWDVLVLDAQQASVAPTDFVQVTGTVRRLDIAQLEEELGTDLDDALYEPFEGDLVLVAQNVQPAERAPED